MAERDEEELEKAEPSRSEVMTPAATSHPHLGSHKLRRLAASGLGEAGAMQAAVTRMMRTQPEDPRERPTPHVVVLDDVTRGLGLEVADEQRVQQLVGSSVPEFTQKTQTQRIMHARGRLTSTMRDALKHVDADKRDEISRRAMAFWRRNYQTDYGKIPTVRFRGAREVEKAMPSGPIPVLTMDGLLSRMAAAKLPAARGQFGGADPSNVSEGGRYHGADLEKAEARGGKYLSRRPDGHGGWIYTYGETHGEGAERVKTPTKKAPFQITTHGGSEQREGVQHGDFALHREKGYGGMQYRVTHKPSGMSAHSTFSRTEAEAMLHHLGTHANGLTTSREDVKKLHDVRDRFGHEFGEDVKDAAKHWHVGDKSYVGRAGKPPKTAAALEKAEARGGKYYRRIPTGNPKRPWRYFYHESEYQQYLREQHVHGPDVAASKVDVEPGAPSPRPKPQQLGLDFSAPPAVAEPPPKPRPTEPVIIPLWLETRRREALHAIETANEHRMRVKLEGARTVQASLYGPGADRGKAWLEEHVVKPLEAALAKLTSSRGPALVVPTHGRPEAKEHGLEVTGTPSPATPASEVVHVGGHTFPHLRTIKEHGGKWNAAGKFWIVPAERAAELATKLPGAAHDVEGATITVGKKSPPPSPKAKPVDPFAEFDKPAEPAPEPPKPAEPPPAPPVERPAPRETVFDRPPPGGWSDEDKVPESYQREAEERRKQADARRKKHLMLDFKVGQMLTINGKRYRVAKDAYDVGQGRFGRLVALEPAEGRATKPRELQIYPTGHAELRSRGSTMREEVYSLEGGTPRTTAWEPPKPEPKVVVPIQEPPKPTSPPPEGHPRAEAKEETKRMKEEGEYINDRASKIEQRGEDVLGSARHKAAVWKSLREALDSKDAETMFTREFLQRQEPVELVSRAQKVIAEGSPARALKVLIAHLSLNKFPAKPEIPKLSEGIVETYYFGKRFHAEYRHGMDYRSGGEKPTLEEHTKRQRESYYEAWARARKVIEKAVDDPQNATDPLAAAREIGRELRALHDQMRGEYGARSAGAQAIARMHDATVKRGKMSVLGQANDFVRRLNTKYGEGTPERIENIGKHVLPLLEGKSFNEAFGTKGEKKKDIDIASLYNTSKMQRSGPPSEYRSAKQGLDLLDKSSGGKFQMRGVQWGKSVTDEEREHHLKSVVDSFNDLTDVLGLPPAMASFNGRLAIAIGARGKAGASAHYEPVERVINLTRDSGAGALAHEWGHMFDNLLFEAAGQPTLTGSERRRDARYASEVMHGAGESPKQDPTFNAMSALQSSEAMHMVRRRIAQDFRALKQEGLIGKGGDYWLSTREVFARCFERYVQRKLEKSGRKNTYLSGLMGTGQGSQMWPNDAEVDTLIPHFDRLFEAFAASPLLHKAFSDLLSRPRIAPEYREIVGSRLVIPRGP